jgi:hypothetical protein
MVELPLNKFAILESETLFASCNLNLDDRSLFVDIGLKDDDNACIFLGRYTKEKALSQALGDDAVRLEELPAFLELLNKIEDFKSQG